MERRDLFRKSLAGALGVFGLTTTARAAESSARIRVVYHLSDLDKVNFVLGNIQNHLTGVGGHEVADRRPARVAGPTSTGSGGVLASGDILA